MIRLDGKGFISDGVVDFGAMPEGARSDESLLPPLSVKDVARFISVIPPLEVWIGDLPVRLPAGGVPPVLYGT
jgi:hypothetical protein